jgi:hypothetical protein
LALKKTRYAITAGLIADLAGIIAAIVIAYVFFGSSINTTNYSQDELAEQFVASINKHDYNTTIALLDEDVVLYDLARDTLAKNDSAVVKRFFLQDPLSITVTNSVTENNQAFILMKGDATSGIKKTLKLVIEKQKIQSIKYLGNF